MRHQGPLDPSPHIKPYPTPIIDLRSGLGCALIDRQALISVNCALNKGAVLLCSCSYAGSPCEIASRLPSVRIYHASDGPLRPRANQHIRFGLRSSSRSLASSPRCALCVQRRPQLLAGSRRRGRCPPEKPRRGGRCGSCFRYLRNGQVLAKYQWQRYCTIAGCSCGGSRLSPAFLLDARCRRIPARLWCCGGGVPAASRIVHLRTAHADGKRLRKEAEWGAGVGCGHGV